MKPILRNQRLQFKSVNKYLKQLSGNDIIEKRHRGFVGGLWEEMGRLQLDFLIKEGLKPEHKLLDIGCGCLRGGVHFLRFLDAGKYHGLDINKSLIEAGKVEVLEAGLDCKEPQLIVDDFFSIGRFETKFDFMISVSLFTHISFNMIVRCLTRVRENLLPQGVYYSSFFQAPYPAYLEPIQQNAIGIVSRYDANPFHYSMEELACAAALAKLELTVIGDWGHSRNQQMASFRLPR
jgi:SAM-dependent methyltransferase